MQYVLIMEYTAEIYCMHEQGWFHHHQLMVDADSVVPACARWLAYQYHSSVMSFCGAGALLSGPSV